MVSIWPRLPASARSQITLLASKSTEGCRVLLEAARNDPGLRLQLGPTFRRTTRTHQNQQIRESALALFGPDVSEGFAAKRARYAESVVLAGNPERGRQIYLERCASCHRAGNNGVDLGPDLLTVAGAGRESLLTNILDPNREVAPRYELWTAERQNDEPLSGILVEETSDRITLRMAGGTTETIDPKSLSSLTSTGGSLMPVGLEEGLSAEVLAGLLRFIEEQADPQLRSFAE